MPQTLTELLNAMRLEHSWNTHMIIEDKNNLRKKVATVLWLQFPQQLIMYYKQMSYHGNFD